MNFKATQFHLKMHKLLLMIHNLCIIVC